MSCTDTEASPTFFSGGSICLIQVGAHSHSQTVNFHTECRLLNDYCTNVTHTAHVNGSMSARLESSEREKVLHASKINGRKKFNSNCMLMLLK